jgi:hypothetical protein
VRGPGKLIDVVPLHKEDVIATSRKSDIVKTFRQLVKRSHA